MQWVTTGRTGVIWSHLCYTMLISSCNHIISGFVNIVVSRIVERSARAQDSSVSWHS